MELVTLVLGNQAHKRRPMYELVPNSGQSLGQTRDPIRNNFLEIKNSFDVNHNDFDAANTGKHFFVEFPAGTDKTTSGNEVGVYCKLQSSKSQLFLRRDGSTDTFALTASVPANTAGQYYSWLPTIEADGALTIITGTSIKPTSATYNLALNITLTAVYSVLLTASGGRTDITLAADLSGLSPPITTIPIKSSSGAIGATNFSYLVIGKQ